MNKRLDFDVWIELSDHFDERVVREEGVLSKQLWFRPFGRLVPIEQI